MHFLPDYIDTYANAHTKVTEKDLLKKLERQTHLEIMMPQMLSGHLQGQYLAFLSRMIKPNIVLEIGTYTGYSAICLSSGLQEGGKLHTIDNNLEIKSISEYYIQKAGLSNQVIQHQGNALDIIPKLDFDWDLVFMDADKINYITYYDLLIPKLKKGAYIIADNVLWSGTVPLGSKEKKASALRAFNKKVMEDTRVKNILLPLRDGLMMIEKI